MTDKKKRPLLGFIARVFGSALVRGTLKSLPGVSLAYEIADTVKFFRSPENKGKPLPHSPLSMLAQFAFLSMIVYAFFTHQITIDDVMKYVLPSDFQYVGAPTDSIPG